MPTPLRALLVEDSADDAALVLHELKRGGFEVEYQLVDSPTAFVAAIEEHPWDVILSDFAMPQFNGLLAFDMTLERGLDIPFIFVSGRIGEDRAAEAMRRGAKDYVLKDNLRRLVPALERELRDAEDRRKRRATAHALRESEEKYRTLLESSIQGVGVIRNLKVLFANAAFAELFGFGSLGEMQAEASIADFLAPEDRPKLDRVYRDGLAGREMPARTEMRALRKDGAARVVDASLKVVRWDGQDAVLAILVDITERKRAEEELRNSEAKFRAMLESSIQGVCVHRDFKLLFANDAFARLHGYGSVEEVKQQGSILDLLAPDMREAIADRYAARRRGELLPARFDLRALRKDGSVVFCDASATTIQWDGAPAAMVVMVDITERKRAEERLHANERLLETVFDTIPLSLTVKDRSSRYVKVNRAWCERYGLDARDAVGKQTLDMPGRPGADMKRAFSDDLSIFDSGQPLVFDGIETVREGRQRHFQTTKSPLRDEAGNVTGLVGVTVDLTELKRAEEEVRASQRLLRTLFDALPVPLVVKDAETRYLMANAAWCERYGMREADVIGKTTMEMSGRPVRDRADSLTQDRETLSSDKKVIVFEGWDTTASGEIRHYQSIRAPLRDESGRATGLVGATVDLTELKRAEEKLKANEQLLQTVFDTIPVSVRVTDRDGGYLMVNRAWCRFYDTSPEEILGKNSAQVPVRPETERTRALQEDQEVLAGSTRVADSVYTSTRGGLRYVRSHKAPLRNGKGEVAGMVGIYVDLTPEKRAQEELRASQRLLQAIFDTIPHAVMVKDRQSRYLMVNRAWCSRYGLTPEQAIGVETVGVPGRADADKQVAFKEDERVFAAGRTVQFEGIDTIRHGERSHFQTIKAPLLDDNGEISGLVGVVVDTTGLKQAEEEVRASQRLLRTVFDAIPHHIVVKDKNFRFLMVNRAWCDTHGLTEAEALNRTNSVVSDLTSETRLAINREEAVVMAGEGSTRTEERAIRDKTGRLRTLHDIRAPIRDEAGQVVGVVGIGVDLTAEREAQNKADLAHARLYDAIESLPAAFFLYDEAERIVLWNSRVREFYPDLYQDLEPGMTFEQTLQRISHVVLGTPGDGNTWLEERLGQFRKSSGPYQEQLADGRWLQGLDRRTSDGGTVCLRFDISELKAREQELRQAQKMEAVGQLTGGVAHDFNNLLQVISGYIELAMQDVNGDPAATASLKTAEEACRRAADLTRHLLAFSRKQVLRLERLDLNETIRGIVKLLGRLLPGNIALEVREGKAVEAVTADRSMIEQVLMNLAVNARDAMPDGGTIVVETGSAELDAPFCSANPWAKPGSYAVLRFGDKGVGMAPEVQERIFEPFFTTKGPGRGTGLGLSTVYGIVQQHEGLIRVESQLGAGTTFSIYLPAGAQSRLQVEDTSPEPLRGGTETILVAEDERQVRAFLVQTLTSAGYTVLEAADGRDAVALAAKASTPVELAVLDMTMPKLGGREVHRRVREVQPGTRALFTSGWFSPEEQRTLMAQGFPFLHKPYSREQLLRAVRRALDQDVPAGATSDPAPAKARFAGSEKPRKSGS